MGRGLRSWMQEGEGISQKHIYVFPQRWQYMIAREKVEALGGGGKGWGDMGVERDFAWGKGHML